MFSEICAEQNKVMHMKTRYYGISLAAAVLAVATAMTAYAQVNVSLPSAEARVGDVVALDVTVDDMTGRGVIAYEFTLEYDEDVIEITTVDLQGTLSENVSVFANVDTPGVIRVAAATTEALAGSGLLLKLKGIVLSEATTSLTFTRFMFNEGDPVAATLDGNLSVKAASGVASEDEGRLPEEFQLRGAYPNPFNPSTTIRFDLPEASEVGVVVIDLLGHQVLSVPSRQMAAGANQTLRIDASSLASGTYVYRVMVRGSQASTATGTMTLLK